MGVLPHEAYRRQESSDTYITPVLLLCTECQQPIKATITIAQWVKVEWIGPSGECQSCHTLKKQRAKELA